MTAPRADAIAVVTRYYDTFNRGDREAFLALLAPDVRHDINQGGSETGVPAFRAFLARMDRCYREQVVELRVIADDAGTHAAAEFIIVGTYLATDEGLPPATGQTYRLPVAAFFDLRDGAVARITNHYNLADWLRQIGQVGGR
jgi:steroid delta-isomerase-like uncharacterized protein